MQTEWIYPHEFTFWPARLKRNLVNFWDPRPKSRVWKSILELKIYKIFIQIGVCSTLFLVTPRSVEHTNLNCNLVNFEIPVLNPLWDLKIDEITF